MVFFNEWVGKGINVNVIVFGYIVIDNIVVLWVNFDWNIVILGRILVGCWGMLEDFKGVVVFLVLVVLDYMSGLIMLVDGGWMGW